MNSRLEIDDLKLIGKLEIGVSLVGKLSSSISLVGNLETRDLSIIGKLVTNRIPYYETANEYGYTVYIG